MATLRLVGLAKTYTGPVDVIALQDATVTIEQGEYVVIEGPSGSGKSTMLNQIALLDTPTGGGYFIDDIDTTTLSDVERAHLRSSTFSFIFQSFHLLDGRNVLDNVALGTLYRGLPAQRRRELAHKALSFVGLEHKAEQDTATLSGGERQRVAIARAIASGAPVLVADEPTGNLDQANGQQVMDTLEALNAQGITIILVTHDPAVASRAPRRLHVLDGVVSEALPAGTVPSPPTLGVLPTPGTLPSPKDLDLVGENPSPTPEGTSSKVRIADALSDAWKGLWAKPARTIALVASVALGVGLALTTAGLAQTAQYQVSDIFDAQRNQRVAMQSASEQTSPAGLQAGSRESLERVKKLAGVEDALIAVTHGQHEVSASPLGVLTEQRTPYDLVGLVDGYVPSEIITIETGNGRIGALGQDNPGAETGQSEGKRRVPALLEGEVLLGAQLAQEINLGPLLASPVVWIDGQPKRVVGVVTDAGLELGLLRSVITTEEEAATFSDARYYSAEVKVAPGAAQQVAGQGPVAWVPASPDSVRVDAPPDPTTLRENIESNLQTMLLTLTGVALLAAVLSMTNAMTAAVFQRIGEFGLRRAIGARRVHVTGLVMSESAAIGVMGGIVGVYAAVLVILGVTLVRQWQPVLDPILIPLGIVGGTLVGFLGGLVATQRASRIEPSDALRA